MIFVTVGSQKFPFDRLIKQLDQLVAEGVIKDTVFAQIGSCTYEPQHIQYERFVDRKRFAELIDQCDMLITHGGEGAIMTGLLHGKKLVAVVRYGKYGEHVNDHQLMIVKALESLNHIVAVYDEDNLGDKIALARVKTLVPYQPGNNEIIKTITSFIG